MIRSISVIARLILLCLIAMVATVVVGVFGYNGLVTLHDKAELMYNSATKPAVEIGTMNGTLGKVIADLLLIYQHNPSLPYAALHDHPTSVHFESIKGWRKVFEDHLKSYKASQLNDAERKLIEGIEHNYVKFSAEVLEPLIARLQGGDYSPEGVQQLLEGFQKYVFYIEKDIGELLKEQNEIALAEFEDIQSASRSANIGIVVTNLLSAAGLLVVAFLILSSIIGPLKRVQDTLSVIEQTHDFTTRIQVVSKDEVSKMASAINSLLSSVQQAFKSIFASSEQLDAVSKELAEASSRVAKGSESTSDSSSNMAASVEEMTASIAHVSDNAKETSKDAEDMKSLSESGVSIVGKTVSEMRQMADAVKDSSDTISELGKHSEQISGIVQTIKDVADQTNLLALNAAIEAARAGEQGRGFAVVADEIRKLAERTTSATTEIAAMISAIQESSHAAVSSMLNAADRVSEGVRLAEQAGGAITDIQAGADRVQTRVADITSALNEQSIAGHQISDQVEKVAQATDENSEAAKSSFEIANNIAQLAGSMRQAMSKFKV
ncbi:MAG: methyl-accepting chemotaxis protein [Helicobacteraceae bacterium]|jgi:methyl-accepting chemotaxis protein|nr:methyl-accepting chemotaxis protein [Helicobacteraceae bacterium]